VPLPLSFCLRVQRREPRAPSADRPGRARWPLSSSASRMHGWWDSSPPAWAIMGACAFGGRQRGASLLHSVGSISAAVQHGI